jgi:hypothetical protein
VAVDKIIMEAHLSSIGYLVLQGFAIFMAMLLILLPYLITVFYPETYEKKLEPVKKFCLKYGNQIANAYSGLMGIYLILQGLHSF